MGEGGGRQLLDQAASWVVAGVVALAPLPFGSAEIGWIATWCLILALALACIDIRRIRSAHFLVLGSVLVVAASFFGLVALQVTSFSPLPPNDIWEEAATLLGRGLSPTVSINTEETLRALGSPLAILMSFLCAFILSIERSKARLITAAVLYSGVAYALLGIVQTVLDPDALLWAERTAYVGDLTGTFVNRNTAATYFGCCLILWTVRLVAEFNEGRTPASAGLEGIRISIFDHLTPKLGVDLFCAFACFSALMLTHSRAGILFSLFSVFVTVVLQVRRELASRTARVVGGIGLVLTAILLLELFAGGVAVRITGAGLIDADRLRAYNAALTVASEHAWFGTGFGTFPDVFPVYRPTEMSTLGLWEQAHNVFLEHAVELGFPMAVLIALLWIGGLAQLFRGTFSARRGIAFVLGGFGAALLGCLHSLVDFSPQIPGFSIVWVALLGCGLAQSIRRPDARPAYRGFDRAEATSPAGDASVARA